jgi:hypothetical protein
MISVVPVEQTHNWKDWDVRALDADTSFSFAHGFGSTPDYFAITPELAPGVPLAAGGVVLAAAGFFGVLAGTTVTNTGPSVIGGNVGVSPGSAVTGFPPGTALAILVAGAAAQAQLDLTAAYIDAAGRGGAVTILDDLSGQTLTPGVYSSLAGNFSIAAGQNVTLNGAGTYIFQMATTLITGAGATITFTGGATPENVNWQVGSSATLGIGTVWAGNILALTSITLTTGATLNGRALARNGAVTLDTNLVSFAGGGGGGGGVGVSVWAMTVDPVYVTLMKAAAPGSGGASPGVSIVAKAFAWRPHSAKR